VTSRFQFVLCCICLILGYISIYVYNKFITREDRHNESKLENGQPPNNPSRIASLSSKKNHHIDREGIDITPFYSYSTDDNRFIKRDRISVATHMSISNSARFQRLLDLASRWDGYISVAIYTKQASEVTKIIDSFIESHKQLFDDKLTFHLVVDNRIDRDTEFYPNNFLRNIAMKHTLTDFVLNLDVDFIPSLHSHKKLQSHVKRLDSNSLSIIILPAFERILSDNEDWATITSDDLPDTKKQLLKDMRANSTRIYTPFHHSYFSAGHGPTDYARWYKASDPYQVGYKKNFEPYYVVQKSTELPQFWEHFTGFGKNKLSWVEEMALVGYEFHVTPNAFLIHINHQHTKDNNVRVVRKEIFDEYSNSFCPYLTATYGEVYWMEKSFAENDWDTLPNHAKNAAKLLGFNKDLWDYNELIPLYETPLNELYDAERDAAKLLGLEIYFDVPTPWP